jgi:hypothetical protein
MLAKSLGFQTYAFASPIKMTVNALFNWDTRHADGELKEVIDPVWGFSPREAYQKFGTDWGRNMLRDDIWLKYAEGIVARRVGTIITDLRFENEAEWVRRQNGLIVHVKREGQFGIMSAHVSEAGIKSNGYDYTTTPCVDLTELAREATVIEHIARQGRENC